jgi:hypothetical protein
MILMNGRHSADYGRAPAGPRAAEHGVDGPEINSSILFSVVAHGASASLPTKVRPIHLSPDPSTLPAPVDREQLATADRHGIHSVFDMLYDQCYAHRIQAMRQCLLEMRGA